MPQPVLLRLFLAPASPVRSRSARVAALVVPALLAAACEAPCSRPIRYRIGQVDPRFGLAREEMLAALRQAEGIWEAAGERELFVFAEDGEMAVNFVYDERQRTSQENAVHVDDIDRTVGSLEALNRRHQRARAEVESATRDYRKVEAEFDARLAAHNREVERWNSRGGAPPDAKARLDREGSELERLEATLENGRQAINALVEEANDLQGRARRLASEVKEDVDAVNASAGREFQQGRFVLSKGTRRIDIFEYNDRIDLVHVLAHEMGHALGLLHVDDDQAIMYGKASTKVLRLADSDRRALAELCGAPQAR